MTNIDTQYVTLWDDHDCAAYLRLSPRSLPAMRVRGTAPPHVTIGRRVRYIPDVVVAWARAHMHRSTSDPGTEDAA